MEFKVSTDLSLINPTEITFNKEEIKAELSSRLSMYKGMLVTDENIAEAKKVRANIRKVETAINDEKKRVKNAFTAPYLRFEADVKEIMAMCSEVSNEIDASIKELESRKKESKRSEIINYFEAKRDKLGLGRFVSFQMIEDPKWLNATVSLEEAFLNINEMLERFAEDVESVTNITDDETEREALLSMYENTHSVSKVLSTYKAMQYAKEEKERKRIEFEKQKEQQQQQQQAVESVVPAQETKAEESIPVVQAEEQQTLEISFKIWATREQLNELKNYLIEHGIKYGKA